MTKFDKVSFIYEINIIYWMIVLSWKLN